MIVGPTIRTANGRYINLVDPKLDDILIEDIAHALSNLCRFTGHCTRFYSVAEHSVNTSHVVDPYYGLEALMHDASEAYLGDVSNPLKKLLPEYVKIEKHMEKTISQRFGLPFPMSPEIKVADLCMLATEKRDLMPASTKEDWSILNGYEPYDFEIIGHSPEIAYLIFMSRFRKLGEK